MLFFLSQGIRLRDLVFFRVLLSVISFEDDVADAICHHEKPIVNHLIGTLLRSYRKYLCRQPLFIGSQTTLFIKEKCN